MSWTDTIFRRMPLFKGKERLAKFVFNRQISGKRNRVIKGRLGCEYLVPNIVENIGFEIFINGIYEPDTSDFIVRTVPEDGVFLDLGANIGAITIPVLTKRRDLTIVCVEAAPWIYHFLEKNLARNGGHSVYAVNKALYHTDNEILNFYSPDDKFGKGSLSPVFTDKVVQVNTVRTDSLLKDLGIQKVDLIKIDVEGYEWHAFKGAETLLGGAGAPDIIFEFVDWAEEAANGTTIGASQQFLRDMGYRIYYFKKSGTMEEVRGILKKGFFMLYATKKNT